MEPSVADRIVARFLQALAAEGDDGIALARTLTPLLAAGTPRERDLSELYARLSEQWSGEAE